MSDTDRSDLSSARPAIGFWELESIAEGIWLADQIIKNAPVPIIATGTVHPGRYVIAVTGDAASVEVAREVVEGCEIQSMVDTLYLADVSEEVLRAVVAGTELPASDAAGVVETRTLAASIVAADAAVKDSDVGIGTLALGDGLGGKAYFVVGGTVSEVASAVAAADAAAGDGLVRSVVIPQLTDEMRTDLRIQPTFHGTLRGAT